MLSPKVVAAAKPYESEYEKRNTDDYGRHTPYGTFLSLKCHPRSIAFHLLVQFNAFFVRSQPIDCRIEHLLFLRILSRQENPEGLLLRTRVRNFISYLPIIYNLV